ncbi:response regulator transcription factor [Streptomyces sp. enrichment culture]|uniref:response regulator transcription factor n=1 Tax=Streptomyces sp. enrichment culture TaxID=1795815 RepID=UPI003F54556F
MRVLFVLGDGCEPEFGTRKLKRYGNKIFFAHSAQQALAMHTEADFIIIDLGLTDADGLEVCRAIRQVSDTPMIAVTEQGDELERVLGLKAGADDCIDRGCGIRELVARIEAVTRRSRARHGPSGSIVYGPLRIDQSARAAWLAGEPINLTRKEFDLLLTLASRPGVVLTRKELMSRVWNDSWTRGRTIDTHVNSLRSKLGSNNWIVTVRGVGFRFGECVMDAPALPETSDTTVPAGHHRAASHAVPPAARRSDPAPAAQAV